MVSLNDLGRVQTLVNEKNAIVNATTMFDNGGRILSMNVGLPPPEEITFPPNFGGINVPTSYIEYPPEMLASIKAAFATRLHAIEAELTSLGVTDIQPPPTPAQAPVQPIRRRRP